MVEGGGRERQNGKSKRSRGRGGRVKGRMEEGRCEVWNREHEGNSHTASLCILAKTRSIKVQDTAEPQVNMDNPHEN